MWAIGSDGDDVGIGVYGSAEVRNNVVFNITGRGMRIGQDGTRTFEKVRVWFNTMSQHHDSGPGIWLGAAAQAWCWPTTWSRTR